MSWGSFLDNVNRDDNICVFTIGRMHPFHKGHKELVCDVMRKTKQITDKGVKATAYVYLSATNEESGWITDDNITKTINKGKESITIIINDYNYYINARTTSTLFTFFQKLRTFSFVLNPIHDLYRLVNRSII